MMSDLTTDERCVADGSGRAVSGPMPDPIEAPARVRTVWWLLLTGILLSLATLAGALVAGIRPRLKRAGELNAAATEVATSLPRVPVVNAKAASTTTERILPGDSHPLQEAALYARTAGYLKSRRADIGDRVKEGDLLAEISSPEVDAQLEQARATQLLTQANLERDQATSANADAELLRSRKLIARAVVTPQEHEAFLAKDRVADANVKAAESSLKMNAAAVHRLETLQSFQNVTAPFSGIITARNIDPGDLVSADTSTTSREIFHIVQMDRSASSRTSRRCSRPTSRSARRPSSIGRTTPSRRSRARSREPPTPSTPAPGPS